MGVGNNWAYASTVDTCTKQAVKYRTSCEKEEESSVKNCCWAMPIGQNPTPFISNRILAKGWGVGQLLKIYLKARRPCKTAMVKSGGTHAT